VAHSRCPNRVSPLRGFDASVSRTRGGAPRLPPLRSAPGCHVTPLRGFDASVSCTRGGAPRLPPLRSAPGCHVGPLRGGKTFNFDLSTLVFRLNLSP
jgi:hypothetical protein